MRLYNFMQVFWKYMYRFVWFFTALQFLTENSTSWTSGNLWFYNKSQFIWLFSLPVHEPAHVMPLSNTMTHCTCLRQTLYVWHVNRSSGLFTLVCENELIGCCCHIANTYTEHLWHFLSLQKCHTHVNLTMTPPLPLPLTDGQHPRLRFIKQPISRIPLGGLMRSFSMITNGSGLI